MKLAYTVEDKPAFGQRFVFALQQLLAILAATVAVPAIVGNGMSTSAALFGAGIGTIVYQICTRRKSPVFLGSSFAFIGSMFAAFGGAVSVAAGYAGIVLGAFFAGLAYVVIALVIKFAGVAWIDKLMPPVVIGPTVSLIGLSLAGAAINDLAGANTPALNGYVCIICGLVTLFAVMLSSVFGKKMAKMIPFIIGICAGYLTATIFTLIGKATGNDSLLIVNFALFKEMTWIPDFTFITAFKGFKEIDAAYVGTVAVAYVPVALVVLAEHIADHKNISSIIERDLLKEPGLDHTLMGDGLGSMVGAFFGGCPNTTYGESVGCVAISGCASVSTITLTAILAMIASFFAPFVTLLRTIPNCVMGGVCVSLYGFISVSGLKMIQKVDLEDNSNLFTVCVILIIGTGGMVVTFGAVTITAIACAILLGILTNVVLKKKNAK